MVRVGAIVCFEGALVGEGSAAGSADGGRAGAGKLLTDCVMGVSFGRSVSVGACWGGVAGMMVRVGDIVCFEGALVGEGSSAGSADEGRAGSGEVLTDCVMGVLFVRSVLPVGGFASVCVLGVGSGERGNKFLCWCGDALMKLLIVVWLDFCFVFCECVEDEELVFVAICVCVGCGANVWLSVVCGVLFGGVGWCLRVFCWCLYCVWWVRGSV
jgi:hypothetical protein